MFSVAEPSPQPVGQGEVQLVDGLQHPLAVIEHGVGL